MIDLPRLAAQIAEIAVEAGQLIMEIRAGDYSISRKTDASPVTDADARAEILITRLLTRLAPSIPVIGEEAVAANGIPAVKDQFFLVDPLDGTREFIRGGTDFTVNIALILGQVPVLGVIFAPAWGRLFVAPYDKGAQEFAVENFQLRLVGGQHISCRPLPENGAHIVTSRSHRNTRIGQYLATFPYRKVTTMGSSLKFCLVATGEADLYPRHGPTMEWDTAAGQAILEHAGGAVTTLSGHAFRYGKTQQLLKNPGFFAWSRPPDADVIHQLSKLSD